MDWAVRQKRIETATIVGGVTALHAAFLGWALSVNISPDTIAMRETIQVDFAERPPEISPPIEAAAPQARVIEPVPSNLPPVEQAEAPAPNDTVSAPAPENDRPSVLTQNAQSNEATIAAGDTRSTGRLSEAQIAQVFKQLDCQKLKDQRHSDCPETDPFTATMTAARRREVAPKVWADSTYINRPVIEQFFKREADARFNWPDADLFADPMAPGAYDAQRIRDAREPLWSQEMREGFRKAD